MAGVGEWLDDKRVCERAVAGEGAAIAELLDRCGRQARALARSGEDAAALAADTVADLLTPREGMPCALATYGGSAPLDVWLRVVLSRKLCELRRPPRLEDALATLLPPGFATLTNAEDQLLRQQVGPVFKACFRQAVAHLSSQDRLLLKLRVVDGVTLEAIARLMGVNRTTVVRHLSRVRSELVSRTEAAMGDALSLPRDDVRRLLAEFSSALDPGSSVFRSEFVP
jgi:RNA polymerase sigma-70 factor